MPPTLFVGTGETCLRRARLLRTERAYSRCVGGDTCHVARYGADAMLGMQPVCNVYLAEADALDISPLVDVSG